jgi:isopenicillin-N epimerase
MVKKSCGLPAPRGDLQPRNSFNIRTRRIGSKKYEATTQLAHHLVHHPDELDGVREFIWGQPQIGIQMSRKSRLSYTQAQNVIYRTPLRKELDRAGFQLVALEQSPSNHRQRLMADSANDWKKQWDLRADTIYLNHGSFGPPPRAVQQARQRWQAQLDAQPMDFFVRQYEAAYFAARESLAKFVGAEAHNLVFAENATAAMNHVAASVRLQAGDEVLLTDHEYGAVQRIWERACNAAQATIVVAKLPRQPQSAADVVAAITSGVSPRTRMAVFSHITSATAMTLPVGEICMALRERGVIACIDGPHAVAQVELNLDALDADFYCASCHKWLCAPFGSGFFYAAPRQQARVRPAMLSWGRVVGDDRRVWSDEFVWSGTRDPSSYLAVPAAIEFLEQAGLDTFRQQTHALAQYARRQLLQFAPREPLVPDDRQWYGSMAHLPLPPGDARSLQRALWEQHHIEVPVIEWDGERWIRVSCHLYNTSDDVDRLVTALAKLLPRE